jgi:hypothetical protein
MASACSGILAYGLMQLKGRAGLDGWNWIFIVSVDNTTIPVSFLIPKLCSSKDY